MNEIEIKTVSGDFILNNNSNKYERAKKDAGHDASPEEILAHYDKLSGLIKDKQGRTIQNGIFWEAYSRWQAQKPEFVKILDQREKSLDEGEGGLIELTSLNVDHKRAFLGTLMTISAATIAGLFFLFTNNGLNNDYLVFLAKLSGLGHASFILASSVWLTFILSQESSALDRKLTFVRESRNEFVNKVGSEIINIDTYEKYRNTKTQEEKDLKKPIWGDSEKWFVGLCILFTLASLPLIFMFLLS